MGSDHQSPFANRLRQLREAAMLSQDELAERAGLSLRGISDLERGVHVTPRLETVRLLANALGLNEHQRQELVHARGPSIKSSTIHAGNELSDIPVVPTSFVGRESEVDLILEMLRSGNTRLLTLNGPGGVGKTRITIEVANQINSEDLRQVVFVDLSSVRNPDLVLVAIAGQLGVQELGGLSIKTMLESVLRNRQLLLIADNMEQIKGAVPDLGWLVAKFPDLHILATSRSVLHLAGEQVMLVQPMTVRESPNLDDHTYGDAFSLFVTRARSADANFVLDEQNTKAIAYIVARLQGMPLAIELAAARTRTLPVMDIVAQLDSQLKLLAGGPLDAPSRQWTMSDTIAWSYRLLTNIEQSMFRVMSVFPAGCTLTTAAGAAVKEYGFDESDVVEAVHALVDGSLVRAHRQPDGNTYYQMLQHVQEFGHEQLMLEGEMEAVRETLHTQWCLPLAEAAEFLVVRPFPVPVIETLKVEYVNLSAHVSWLIASGKVEQALSISGLLASYRGAFGYLKEGKDELMYLLAHPENQCSTRSRARAFVGLGIICFDADDYMGALEAMQTGESLAREIGECDLLELALHIQRVLHTMTGPLDAIDSKLDALQKLECDFGQRLHFISPSIQQAYIAERDGDREGAYNILAANLVRTGEQGYIWFQGVMKTMLAEYLAARNSLDEAEALVTEALQTFQAMGALRELPGIWLNLADFSLARGDTEEYHVFLNHALDTAREIGSLRSLALCYERLAKIAAESGDMPGAFTRLHSAIQWHMQCGNATAMVRCLDDLSDICLFSGEVEKAVWCLGAADSMQLEYGVLRTERQPEGHQQRLDTLLSMHDPAEYREHHQRGFNTPKDQILFEVRSWN